MEAFFAIYKLVVNVLINLAIVIHFFTAKDNSERFTFVVAITGFFALDALVGDLFLAQFFVAAWLVLMDRPLMISKHLVLGLLAVAAVVQTYSPEFIFVSAVLYIVILWGFLYSAFEKLFRFKLPGASHG